MIDVKSAIREYPDNADEYDTLYVSNHWNYSDRVILQINNEKPRIFMAKDLIAAIENARNTARY